MNFRSRLKSAFAILCMVLCLRSVGAQEVVVVWITNHGIGLAGNGGTAITVTVNGGAPFDVGITGFADLVGMTPWDADELLFTAGAIDGDYGPFKTRLDKARIAAKSELLDRLWLERLLREHRLKFGITGTAPAPPPVPGSLTTSLPGTPPGSGSITTTLPPKPPGDSGIVLPPKEQPIPPPGAVVEPKPCTQCAVSDETITKLSKELAGKQLKAEELAAKLEKLSPGGRAKLKAKFPGLFVATTVILTNEEISKILHAVLDSIKVCDGLTAADFAAILFALDPTSNYIPQTSIGNGKLTFTFTFHDQIITFTEEDPARFSLSIPVNTEVIDAAKPVVEEWVQNALTSALPPEFKCCLCEITEEAKVSFYNSYQECAVRSELAPMDRCEDQNGRLRVGATSYNSAAPSAQCLKNAPPGSSWFYYTYKCTPSTDQQLCEWREQNYGKFNPPPRAPGETKTAVATLSNGVSAYVGGTSQPPIAGAPGGGICKLRTTCKRDSWVNSECSGEYNVAANSIDACLNYVNRLSGDASLQYGIAMLCKQSCGAEYMFWDRPEKHSVQWYPQ